MTNISATGASIHLMFTLCTVSLWHFPQRNLIYILNRYCRSFCLFIFWMKQNEFHRYCGRISFFHCNKAQHIVFQLLFCQFIVSNAFNYMRYIFIWCLKCVYAMRHSEKRKSAVLCKFLKGIPNCKWRKMRVWMSAFETFSPIQPHMSKTCMECSVFTIQSQNNWVFIWFCVGFGFERSTDI